MSHVRTQIRQLVKSLLVPVMPDHTVFDSRKYAINASDLPMVDMRYLNENNDVQSMGNVTMREASLYIRITREENSADIDDVLDADAVIVEHTLAGAKAQLRDLVIEYELMQTNFTDGADGDKPVAELILRYDFMYRTDRNNVEQARV